MNQQLNKDIKNYCNAIKRSLNCSKSMKHAFISEFKNRIYEFADEQKDENVTIQDIENHFGKPKEIAQAFYSTEDMAFLRKKARRHVYFKIISFALLVVVVVLIYILADMIINEHTITITNQF